MRATKAKKRRGVVTAIILAALILFIAAALDGRLGVTEMAFSHSRVPAGFDGTRFALVADPHGSYMNADGALARRIAEEDVDYILLLGDMLNEKDPDMAGFADFLAEITQIAPTFAVSGNHDRWHDYYREFLETCEAAGVSLLEDKELILTRGGDEIRLIGFADPEFWTADPQPGCMDEQLAALPAGEGFDLLLFHRANVFDHVASAGYELVVSGHLHGGVVRLPFYGPLLRRLPVGDMTYAGGRYTVGESNLIVSRGLGNNVAVPRLFNPPELIILTLKTSEE